MYGREMCKISCCAEDNEERKRACTDSIVSDSPDFGRSILEEQNFDYICPSHNIHNRELYDPNVWYLSQRVAPPRRRKLKSVISRKIRKR